MLSFKELQEKKSKIKINPKKDEIIEDSDKPEKENHGEDCGCMKCEKKRMKQSKSDDSGDGPDVSKNYAEEHFKLWVNELVEEGYDLSDYTWEEMFDIYEEEQLDEADSVAKMRERAAKRRQQRYGKQGGGGRDDFRPYTKADYERGEKTKKEEVEYVDEAEGSYGETPKAYSAARKTKMSAKRKPFLKKMLSRTNPANRKSAYDSPRKGMSSDDRERARAGSKHGVGTRQDHDYPSEGPGGVTKNPKKLRKQKAMGEFSKEDFELLVNDLIEEGYDLSEYTWDDMYEIYESEQLDEFLGGLMKMFGGGKSAPSSAKLSPGQQAQKNADALAPYVPGGSALLNRRQQMNAAMKELGYSKGGKVPAKTSTTSKSGGGTAPSTARKEEYARDFIKGVITELRRSEKEGKGSPERRMPSGQLVGARAERKRKGEKGGRHHYSGSQKYGGSESERGKKKNEPGSQHQRLNPPEEKGRQLKRGTKAATDRAYGYGQGRRMGD